jgi:hypothetical protein
MRNIAFGKFCGASRALQTRSRAIIYLNDTPESAALPATTAWPDPVDDGQCANVCLSSPY